MGARDVRARVRAAVASAVWPAVEVAAGLVRRLPGGRRTERLLLARTWGAESAGILDAYLVSGYQNPRINLQSILLRHFLIARLLGEEAVRLMDDEIRFAVELNEVLRARALELGVTMSASRNPAKHGAVRGVDAAIAAREREFTDRWRERLEHLERQQIPVLELACGSANDYRTLAEAGLARHLDYIGVDISEKNIANARRHHPEARFEVADILELPYEDSSFDYIVASDIYEHLSLESMGRALGHATRLARDGLVLTFFNMADEAQHEVRRRRTYFWNLLSRRRIEADLAAAGFGAVAAIPVARWLETDYGYADSYNPNAWTILAERERRVLPLLTAELGSTAPAATG